MFNLSYSSMLSLPLLSASNGGNLIEVGMNEYKRAEAPDGLCTDGVGPCIVLTVYSRKTGSAYMMHEGGLGHTKQLDHFLKEIKKEYGTYDGLSVYVYGNSVDESDCDDSADLYVDRDCVKDTLKKYFSKGQVTYHWLDSFLTGTITLYLSTWRIETSEEDDFRHQIT